MSHHQSIFFSLSPYITMNPNTLHHTKAKNGSTTSHQFSSLIKNPFNKIKTLLLSSKLTPHIHNFVPFPPFPTFTPHCHVGSTMQDRPLLPCHRVPQRRSGSAPQAPLHLRHLYAWHVLPPPPHPPHLRKVPLRLCRRFHQVLRCGGHPLHLPSF